VELKVELLLVLIQLEACTVKAFNISHQVWSQHLLFGCLCIKCNKNGVVKYEQSLQLVF